MRFRLRAGFAAVAIIALALAAIDAWLRAPYRAERKAAVALSRLGGRIVLIDVAPPWLRRYVGSDILEMSVAAGLDLSQSRVTDADLIHLRAFRHFGQINLSDTRISDAGLAELREVVASRYVDLSRTRVTDTSPLFGNRSNDHPLGLKLSGNRVARIFPFDRQWCPLQELDLSGTDADDRTLEALPDGLVNLSKLDLRGTAVSDGGLDSLLRLEGLKKLDLRGTRVTAEGVGWLKTGWRGSAPLTVLWGPIGGVKGPR